MWELTNLKSVEVTDRYFDEALHLDVKNMLLLDPDRLLAGFRETASIIGGIDENSKKILMKGKKRYGGWEDGLIAGHTLGHYIKALSQAQINLGLSISEQGEVKERLDYLIDGLKECQKLTCGTSYEGYIFGASLINQDFIDNPALQFDNVERGKQDIFTQAWVPWYTMHKILSGLNAAFKLAGNKTALEIANSLGLWISRRTKKWNTGTKRTVLGIEYGGMNDCLYELYEINKDLKNNGGEEYEPDFGEYFAAAHSFDEIELFEDVLSGKSNVLNNMHANTMIPKFIGALARYEADRSEKRYLEYAESYWEMVVGKHTYVTGGNSENEHFGEDDVLDAERTNVNNETCNTYNMLKLSRRLFAATGKKKYLDYSEKTLINAIMASQNHESGFTTYFQPMATGYFKVFNTLDGNFWCCTGTGYENFTKLQCGIYYRTEGKLAVALYLASKLELEDYVLIQECDLTKSDVVRINIEPKQGKTVKDDIYLRIPTWLNGKALIRVDNTSVVLRECEGFYIIKSEMISSGANIEVTLPMGTYYSGLVDNESSFAFCYGPFVLSARLGNKKMECRSHGVNVSVAESKCVDNDDINILDEKSVGEFLENLDRHLVKRDGEMEFDLTGTDKNLVFTTHFNQYKESYGIYWHLKA
ncbi:MAG: glycoside hydrolase family 127 protein [Butyrivibrio sp.]|uniref:beta-L-arabinofuranosidase domain-containing protein n=1 Tax=Butyrivibrio sp. TaxID=28121 RepID=UPI001B293672|nr:beta-L-arabinofuranosidase domain-containing protein [Butyrivibrio sp.]MBO6239610.1 glycoside hydrolase family 127 protein [Butyrivibrio sp.]